MNGAVTVLPRDGLTDVNPLHYDEAVYIGEQNTYLPKDEKGKYKSYDSTGEAHTDRVEVMRKLTPTHVVFSGKVGALTGKNALTSKVSETGLTCRRVARRLHDALEFGGGSARCRKRLDNCKSSRSRQRR
jgi:nitrite reductase (NO-forming)